MTDQLEAALNPFIEHPAGRVALHGGVQWRFSFPNSYGASVVQHRGSYGGDAGLWEVAVIGADGNLDYSTPITPDVIGWQTVEEVREILRQIAGLPGGD